MLRKSETRCGAMARGDAVPALKRDDLMRRRLLVEGDLMIMLMILISQYDQSTDKDLKLL